MIGAIYPRGPCTVDAKRRPGWIPRQETGSASRNEQRFKRKMLQTSPSPVLGSLGTLIKDQSLPTTTLRVKCQTFDSGSKTLEALIPLLLSLVCFTNGSLVKFPLNDMNSLLYTRDNLESMVTFSAP